MMRDSCIILHKNNQYMSTLRELFSNILTKCVSHIRTISVTGMVRAIPAFLAMGGMLQLTAIAEAQDDGWQKNQLRMEQNVIVETIVSPDDDTRWILGSHAGISGMRGFSNDGGNVYEVELHGWAVNDVHAIDAENGWAVGDEGKIYKTGNSWEEWEFIDTGLGRFVTFHAIAFSDPDTGWIVGNLGYMYATTDGGENWNEVENELDDEVLYDLVFADEESAWIVGSGGLILHTDDGGENWNEQQTPTEENLLSITLVDTETAWVVGRNGTILNTRDAGDSWEESTDFTDEVRLEDVDFVDQDTGWITGYEGTILHTNDGGENWQVQDSPIDVDIRAVEFFDADRGWAAGSAATILETEDGGENWNYVSINNESVYFLDEHTGWVGGRHGQIMHTRDGGENWYQQSTPIDDENIEDLKFLDKDTGWAIVRQGNVLRTEDGGETWNEQDHLNEFLDKIAAVDDQTAWIIGERRSIFHTDDGGDTWVEQDDGLIAGDLYDVTFVDHNTGFISGSQGRILATVDGGDTWEELETNTNEDIRTVMFLDENTGYIAGGDGIVFKTDDGGESWSNVGSSVTEGVIFDMEVLNPWVVWVLGPRGEIAHTRDGGNNWETQREEGAIGELSALHFTDEQTGWAVGSEGRILNYNGEEIVLYPFEPQLSSPFDNEELDPDEVEFIWRETEPFVQYYQFQLAPDEDFDEVVVDSVMDATSLTIENLSDDHKQYWWRVRAENEYGWGDYGTRTFELETVTSSQEPADIPEGYSVDPNYPNPFNPVTTIGYQLPESAQVKLEVFDMLGRRVATVVEQRQSAGSYEVTFDASGLSSGIYIYRLEAGEFTETQKMNLVK